MEELDLDYVEGELPEKCPKCGGNRFVILGAVEDGFRVVVEVSEDEVKELDFELNSDVYGSEQLYYRVDSVECENCGEPLFTTKKQENS